MSNPTVFLQELPYQPDTAGLFERAKNLPSPLLLDSCDSGGNRGRYDIITAAPIESFTIKATNTDTYDTYLEYFRELEAGYKELCAGISSPGEEIPFCGGIAGYLDYGIGKPLQHLPAEVGARAELNLYQWAVILDHTLQRCTFAALPSLPATERDSLLNLLRAPTSPGNETFELLGDFTSNLEPVAYEAAFRQIQSYILSGDCYQVNLAQRFSARYRGDPWSAYRSLRKQAIAPYSGYMRASSNDHLLCLSPERFLALHGRNVETRPIKGTRPRYPDREVDREMARQLRHSPKDRAENLMIVDLLRNDMGRNCAPGSIHVDSLFEVEVYPNVYHLVSTISGKLARGHSALDLLRDSFPGGSITGAPKRRAMEIIDELEPHTRQAYCGSMLYVSADGRMDSNIAIRSLICRDGDIFCWGGGGIVADSNWEREYKETYDKVGLFLRQLESSPA